MKAILNSPYRYFFLAGFLIISLSAWCSLGYHQMDEHFMILEYPLYKAGVIPQRLIPWEFLQEIRPSLQPYLAQGLFYVLHLIGIDDAFTRTFILRLLSGWLCMVGYGAYRTKRCCFHYTGATPEMLDRRLITFMVFALPRCTVQF